MRKSQRKTDRNSWGLERFRMPNKQSKSRVRPTGEISRIAEYFNQNFSNWRIVLPAKSVKSRTRGKIVEAGWAIWYLFNSDERGEYLDYYASHRMTNDRHVRVYADGFSETLPVISEFRVCSKDSKEDAKREAKFFAKNQAISRMLAKKGFCIEGDEPGGVQINRTLVTKRKKGKVR